jgi:hypothetical protein
MRCGAWRGENDRFWDAVSRKRALCSEMGGGGRSRNSAASKTEKIKDQHGADEVEAESLVVSCVGKGGAEAPHST